MKVVQDFAQVVDSLVNRGTRKTVAVVWALDATTRHAVTSALAEGFADAIFVGCRAEIEADPQMANYADHFEIVDADDPDQAAVAAVELARQGKAQIIMKGMLNTDNLLHALLNKERGLLHPGEVVTHLTVAQISSYGKLLAFSDAAVIPYPTPDQRHHQIKYMVDALHRMGVASPKIALVHCSEKVDPRHFPFTEDYVDICKMAKDGDFGNCIVDGPLDVKTSCSLAALEKKGLHSPLNGFSDGLIFPDIEAANAFYKTITLFSDAQIAGIVVGFSVPVVLPSRGDSVRSKFNSLALAAL